MNNLVSVTTWVSAHWLGWAVTIVAGIASWLVTNVIATPLVQFWSDRRSALETLRKHGSVDWRASEERVREALASVREAAARMMFYAEAGPVIVRLYARVRRYDLHLAGLALNGVHSTIVDGNTSENNSRQCDAVRVCLGATNTMSLSHRGTIRKMLDEAVSNDA
jgi:hypothetical protein